MVLPGRVSSLVLFVWAPEAKSMYIVTPSDWLSLIRDPTSNLRIILLNFFTTLVVWAVIWRRERLTLDNLLVTSLRRHYC